VSCAGPIKSLNEKVADTSMKHLVQLKKGGVTIGKLISAIRPIVGVLTSREREGEEYRKRYE